MNSKEPDENTDYLINLGTALNTGGLVFFILMPALISFTENTLLLPLKIASTVTSIINFILYYVLNIAVVILAVKWQKKKLANRSLYFRKKYLLAVASTFLVLILVQHLW